MVFEKMEMQPKFPSWGAHRRGQKGKLILPQTCPITRVQIEPEVIELLNRYRQFQDQDEAGGILIGRRYSDYIRVEEATEPGPHDRRGHTFFERDSRSAQRAINKAWDSSNGTSLYLGEWHTHPEPFPSPSLRDRKMIASQFENAQPQHGPLVLLIVGTAGCWLGCQSNQLLVYQPIF